MKEEITYIEYEGVKVPIVGVVKDDGVIVFDSLEAENEAIGGQQKLL